MLNILFWILVSHRASPRVVNDEIYKNKASVPCMPRLVSFRGAIQNFQQVSPSVSYGSLSPVLTPAKYFCLKCLKL